MSSVPPTIGASGSGAGGDDGDRRRRRNKAMKMAYAKSRKRRNQKAKRHSNEGGSSKGKERARSPYAPSTDDEGSEVGVPRQVLDAAVQEVHNRFDNEIAHLRDNYQHERRVQAQSAHDTPGASGSGSSHAPAPSTSDGVIKLPENRTGVTVLDIRRACGMEGPEHENDWNDLNNAIRDQMTRFAFDWNHSWKQQDASQLGLLYAAVHADCPILTKFQNSWATKILVQEKFNNRKSYRMRNRRKRGLEPPADPRRQRGKKHRTVADANAARSRSRSHSPWAGLEQIKQSPSPSPPPLPMELDLAPAAPEPARNQSEPVPAGLPHADPPAGNDPPAGRTPGGLRRPHVKARPLPPLPDPELPNGANIASASTSTANSPTRPAVVTRHSSMTVEVVLPPPSSNRSQGSHANDANVRTSSAAPASTAPASASLHAPPESPPNVRTTRPTTAAASASPESTRVTRSAAASIASASPERVLSTRSAAAPGSSASRAPVSAIEPEPEPEVTPHSESRPRYPPRERRLSAIGAANQTAAAIAAQKKRQRKAALQLDSVSGEVSQGNKTGSSKRAQEAGPSKSASEDKPSKRRRRAEPQQEKGAKQGTKKDAKGVKEGAKKRASVKGKGKAKAVEEDASSSEENHSSSEASDVDDGMHQSTEEDEESDEEGSE